MATTFNFKRSRLTKLIYRKSLSQTVPSRFSKIFASCTRLFSDLPQFTTNAFISLLRFNLIIQVPTLNGFYQVSDIILMALGNKSRIISEVRKSSDDLAARLHFVVTILVGMKILANDPVHSARIISLKNEIQANNGISQMLLYFVEHYSALAINNTSFQWQIEYTLSSEYVDFMNSFLLDRNKQRMFIANLININTFFKQYNFQVVSFDINTTVAAPNAIFIYNITNGKVVVGKHEISQDLTSIQSWLLVWYLFTPRLQGWTTKLKIFTEFLKLTAVFTQDPDDVSKVLYSNILAWFTPLIHSITSQKRIPGEPNSYGTAALQVAPDKTATVPAPNVEKSTKTEGVELADSSKAVPMPDASSTDVPVPPALTDEKK